MISYSWRDCPLAGPMMPGYEDRLIEADLLVRPEPPDDVFALPLLHTWQSEMWMLIADVVPSNVKKAFAANPPEYITADDFDWLNDLIWEEMGQSVDILELFADRLVERYRFFRAVHGTRTDDVGQFYRDGISRSYSRTVA